MFFINLLRTDPRAKDKFNEVYEKYSRYVYKIAYNVLKDADQMEDMLQEIFANIWKHFGKIDFDDEVAAKAWISVVARHTAITKYNKNKKITPQVAEIDNDVLYATVSSNSANPADIIVNDATIDYIFSEIEKLGDKYSDLLLLTYKYEMTPYEIADLLKLNVKTVYTRLDRGKAALRKKLAHLNERGTEK